MQVLPLRPFHAVKNSGKLSFFRLPDLDLGKQLVLLPSQRRRFLQLSVKLSGF